MHTISSGDQLHIHSCGRWLCIEMMPILSKVMHVNAKEWQGSPCDLETLFVFMYLLMLQDAH
eukprot:scaffold177233_cov25-Tisochrysis_lutea.AAC.1